VRGAGWGVDEDYSGEIPEITEKRVCKIRRQGETMTSLETMKRHYQRRDLAAREWKQKGGKVVGYVSDDVPEEMIRAAGFFPFRISGDPRCGTGEADRYTEPFYDPSVRSMLNMLLTGRYDFLDFLVVPHSSDAVLRLYYHLRDIRQMDPTARLPEMHLFDILHTRFWRTGLYIRDRVRELKKKLEAWSGKELSNEALSQAIAVANENKSLLKRVSGLREAEPSLLSGMDALQVIGSSMVMLKEDHNTILRRFLSEEKRPGGEKPRLFVEGSSIDNLQFYELVESCGATIVAESHDWGNRSFDDPVDPTLDPVEAIAERYHLRSPSPRMHSIDRRVAYTVERAVQAKSRGAIFFFLEWDSAPAWDYPDQKKALEEKGMPALCFETQPYLLSDADKAQIKTRLGPWLETI
jgi:benzoyl-CoA reductase/2-hydroxyglutaryl-CoA dehydratase subunit BcrC/BadD/HgdB